MTRLQSRYPRLVLVHGPVHASWLNQIEIYFSIVQRKVLTPIDFPDLDAVAQWTTALRTLSLQATFREQTLDQCLPFVQDHRHIFESENIRAACAQISEKDRELLPWDPERIDWNDYWINNQVAGTEKWIQPEAVKDWAFKI